MEILLFLWITLLRSSDRAALLRFHDPAAILFIESVVCIGVYSLCRRLAGDPVSKPGVLRGPQCETLAALRTSMRSRHYGLLAGVE
jgi:hypothetical protein